MNRAERIYRLHALLQGRPHPLVRLQQELEASRATVVRDLGYSLRGERPRYGLPFLPDRIEPAEEGVRARWLEFLEDEAAVGDLNEGAMRLTVTVDRKDMCRTITSLFRLAAASTAVVPNRAWIRVAYG